MSCLVLFWFVLICFDLLCFILFCFVIHNFVSLSARSGATSTTIGIGIKSKNKSNFGWYFVSSKRVDNCLKYDCKTWWRKDAVIDKIVGSKLELPEKWE